MITKFKRAKGYILHRGEVNGEKFVAIATMETSNRKTGNMVQIWFLLENVHPVDAVKSGIDAKTICRECPFAAGNGCYVNLGHAPANIWKAWQRGLYPEIIPAHYPLAFGGRKFVSERMAIPPCFRFPSSNRLRKSRMVGQDISTTGKLIHSRHPTLHISWQAPKRQTLTSSPMS
jgi:hypothetical protein